MGLGGEDAVNKIANTLFDVSGAGRESLLTLTPPPPLASFCRSFGDEQISGAGGGRRH